MPLSVPDWPDRWLRWHSQTPAAALPLIAPAAGKADGRTTALMDQSLTLVRELGLWEAVAPLAAPLSSMRIIDATNRLLRAPTVTFHAAEVGLEAFGYNIPNAPFLSLLEQEAEKRPSLTRMTASLTAVEFETDRGDPDARRWQQPHRQPRYRCRWPQIRRARRSRDRGQELVLSAKARWCSISPTRCPTRRSRRNSNTPHGTVHAGAAAGWIAIEPRLGPEAGGYWRDAGAVGRCPGLGGGAAHAIDAWKSHDRWHAAVLSPFRHGCEILWQGPGDPDRRSRPCFPANRRAGAQSQFTRHHSGGRAAGFLAGSGRILVHATTASGARIFSAAPSASICSIARCCRTSCRCRCCARPACRPWQASPRLRNLMMREGINPGSALQSLRTTLREKISRKSA